MVWVRQGTSMPKHTAAGRGTGPDAWLRLTSLNVRRGGGSTMQHTTPHTGIHNTKSLCSCQERMCK